MASPAKDTRGRALFEGRDIRYIRAPKNIPLDDLKKSIVSLYGLKLSEVLLQTDDAVALIIVQ
jgi:hypothetical protein